MNVSWSINGDSSSVKRYNVRVSKDPEFNKDTVIHKTMGTETFIVIPTINNMDLRHQVMSVQVQSVSKEDTSVSLWSATSTKWLSTLGLDCADALTDP